MPIKPPAAICQSGRPPAEETGAGGTGLADIGGDGATGLGGAAATGDGADAGAGVGDGAGRKGCGTDAAGKWPPDGPTATGAAATDKIRMLGPSTPNDTTSPTFSDCGC